MICDHFHSVYFSNQCNPTLSFIKFKIIDFVYVCCRIIENAFFNG